MSDSLWPHGLQHARLLCPPLSPGVCSDSCPLSWWCSVTISSSATPFSFCLQSFPASGSFPISQLFTSKYWSFTFSNSLSNEYLVLISFRIDWFDLLAVQGTLKSFLQVPQFFGTRPSLRSISHKPHKWQYVKHFDTNKVIGDLHFPTLLYASWGEDDDFVIHYCVLKAHSAVHRSLLCTW